jgi:hypothetical protein
MVAGTPKPQAPHAYNERARANRLGLCWTSEAPFYVKRTFFSGRLRTGLPVAA